MSTDLRSEYVCFGFFVIIHYNSKFRLLFSPVKKPLVVSGWRIDEEQKLIIRQFQIAFGEKNARARHTRCYITCTRSRNYSTKVLPMCEHIKYPLLLHFGVHG